MRAAFVLGLFLLPILALPCAAAANYVVGSGMIQGRLQGDLPTGNATVKLYIVGDSLNPRAFAYVALWEDEGATWPYEFYHEPLDMAERILVDRGQRVVVDSISFDPPALIIIEGNHTGARLKPLDQSPSLFFKLDRSEVAFSYDPRWPIATLWCEPDCADLGGAVSGVLLFLAQTSLKADAAVQQINGRIKELESRTSVNMTVREATLALNEVTAVRARLEEVDAERREQPRLYDAVRQYPPELQAPFEDYRTRALAYASLRYNASMRRLDVIEVRIGNALQVGAFEAQAWQTEQAIQEARRAAEDASAQARWANVWALGALVSFVILETVKWRWPEWKSFQQTLGWIRGRRRG